MDDTETGALPPNHHGDHPGFSGFAGGLSALAILFNRREIARRVADLARVVAGDHVVDLGSGPGAAARVAAHRGAKVTGIEPAATMRRLARWTTRPGTEIDWVDAGAEVRCV